MTSPYHKHMIVYLADSKVGFACDEPDRQPRPVDVIYSKGVTCPTCSAKTDAYRAVLDIVEAFDGEG